VKAVIQRVTEASVEVDGRIVGEIGEGLLVLLAVAKGDGESDGRFLVDKLKNLRIFSDEAGKMNRSLTDIGGSILLISQFTLLGHTRNGRRPSFDEAAPPEEAKRWYEWVKSELNNQGISVETGVFAAHMRVKLLNNGPVTFVLESREGLSAAR